MQSLTLASIYVFTSMYVIVAGIAKQLVLFISIG